MTAQDRPGSTQAPEGPQVGTFTLDLGYEVTTSPSGMVTLAVRVRDDRVGSALHALLPHDLRVSACGHELGVGNECWRIEYPTRRELPICDRCVAVLARV